MKYVNITICLAGAALQAHWLRRTSLGRRALVDSPPRRNNMPFYLPLIPFFFSFGIVSMAAIFADKLTEDWPNWQNAAVDNAVQYLGTILTAILIIILVRFHFARRLKGFGLGFKGFAKDILTAPLYLLTVWPLILAAIWVTIYLNQLTSGQEYQLQQHQQLQVVTEYPQLLLRILVFVGAVLIGPFFEELFFRGLVQTTIRSYLFEAGYQAWPAIVFSSVFFMIMHADPGHWPALFVLGMCMGYAYEKSGSLWRPIFIHVIFNAINVIGTLSN
jgi:membrane protease YdiL (CAAX protease family)